MEIKYYIYYSMCSKNNMKLTILKHRFKLLYETHKQAFIFEGKYDYFKQNGKVVNLGKPQTLNAQNYRNTLQRSVGVEL